MLTTLLATAALALQPPPPTLDQLILEAGADRLDTITTLGFTFRVEKEGKEVAARSWSWDRMANTVTRTVGSETLTFTPGSPNNDAERKADAQWINDSYWFSPVLHLSWAEEPNITSEGDCELFGDLERPFSCLLVQYKGDGGGYTPGDAYRLYVGADNRIGGWDYIPAGKTEPAMTTTFSDYTEAGPLKVATEHRSQDGSFRLHFDGISATTR